MNVLRRNPYIERIASVLALVLPAVLIQVPKQAAQSFEQQEATPPEPTLVRPRTDDSQPRMTPQEIRRYDAVKTLIDWTPEQTRSVPELRELEPAESQQDLPGILRAVGECVAAFFEDFPNTSSMEEVRSGPCGGGVLHKCGVTFKAKFNYLVVPRTEGSQLMGEYRTDAKGVPIDYRSLGHAQTVLTYGFTTVPLQHFHPLNQMASRFRYFGRQMIERRETDVVGFVEVPGKYPRPTEWRHGNSVVPLFIQGLAWIDSTTYQVLRIQTYLLAPPPDLGLESAVTRIEFSAVQLREASAFWLPTKVVVDIWFNRRHLRSIHRYSNFKVFRVETRIGPMVEQ
jgi:hypothetical protein